jgi:hypothetical protein
MTVDRLFDVLVRLDLETPSNVINASFEGWGDSNFETYEMHWRRMELERKLGESYVKHER